MCRTCRYIDPGPSFVFIGPPPSATRPVAAGRRLARPPLPAIRDLDRAPPPPPPSARPAPPSARPAPPPQRPAAPPPSDRPGPASRCGGGGGARTPRHGISSAKNESADFGGLKIDPQNRRVFNFCTKRCAVNFWAGIEKITAIERILRKIFTKNMRGGQNLPPLSSARVKRLNPRGMSGYYVLPRKINIQLCGPKSSRHWCWDDHFIMLSCVSHITFMVYGRLHF